MDRMMQFARDHIGWILIGLFVMWFVVGGGLNRGTDQATKRWNAMVAALAAIVTLAIWLSRENSN
jgi:hypothetical protein